jgi:hypothetical protein
LDSGWWWFDDPRFFAGIRIGSGNIGICDARRHICGDSTIT